jgi:hypothetical protein
MPINTYVGMQIRDTTELEERHNGPTIYAVEDRIVASALT